MQEDVERRTVAISVNAVKLTGRVLAKALAAVARKIQKEHQKAQAPQGKQPVKKLMNHRAAVSSIELSGDTRLFDRVARKYNVDYSFHKVGPNKHLLLFKAGQADAITACFSEYAKRAMTKSRGVNIGERLRDFAEQARTRPRQQERKREAVRDER